MQLHHKMALAEVNRASGRTEGGFQAIMSRMTILHFFFYLTHRIKIVSVKTGHGMKQS